MKFVDDDDDDDDDPSQIAVTSSPMTSGLHFSRPRSTRLSGTTASDCRHVCHPAEDILNI